MPRKLLLCLYSCLLILIGLTIGVLSIAPRSQLVDKPAVVTHLHSGPTLEQIRSLASLVILRVEVADVQVSELHGYSGGVSAVVLVKGDVVLATDLSQARFASVDEQRHEAVILLPPPEPQSPRVDHVRTRLVRLWRSGLWEIVPGDKPERGVLNHAYAEAQQSIENAGTQQSLDERARAQTATVLEHFFEGIGWKASVRWTDRQ